MIQEYRIVDVLGAGSFGIVYKAQNKFFDEIVAIKEFLPVDLGCRMEGTLVTSISSEAEENYQWALRNFLKEAKILWDLSHPEPHRSIVRVTRFIEENGTAYMVMDYEVGQPLSQILQRRKTLPESELLNILQPLLSGLSIVHKASVWHRDIKPSNILIRADGSPVLIDFGAARRESKGATRSIMSSFSPAYAAPEQVFGSGRQGPWTDIYALGATLYQAVTGFRPTNAAERMHGDDHLPAVQAAASGKYTPRFLAAIDAALELQAEKRPQTISQWAKLRNSRIDNHSWHRNKKNLVWILSLVFAISLSFILFSFIKHKQEVTPIFPEIKDDSKDKVKDKEQNKKQKAFKPIPDQIPQPVVFSAFVRSPGHPTQSLNAGDHLSPNDVYFFSVKPHSKSYVYIAQIDSEFKLQPLFPNKAFASYNNPLKASTQYRIPANFRYFTLDKNSFGKEWIYFFFSNKPIVEIERIFSQLNKASNNNEIEFSKKFLDISERLEPNYVHKIWFINKDIDGQ
jgi:serine/threonine protein kinase